MSKMLTLNILHDKLTIQKLNRNQKSFQVTVQEIVQYVIIALSIKMSRKINQIWHQTVQM